jgi:hypothetical protein
MGLERNMVAPSNHDKILKLLKFQDIMEVTSMMNNRGYMKKGFRTETHKLMVRCGKSTKS